MHPLDLQLLFGLHHLGAGLALRFVRRTRSRFGFGQTLGMFGGDHRAFFGPVHRGLGLGRPVFGVGRGLRRLLLPGLVLGAQLCKLVGQARTCIDDGLDFAFQPADFRIGAVQVALRRVQAITCRIVRRAHLLDLTLEAPQARGLGFEFVGDALDLARVPVLFRGRVVALEQPQHMLLFGLFGGQRAIGLRNVRLLAKLAKLKIEFAPDILHPREVFATAREPAFGFLAALLVLRDAGRFFEKDPQFLGFGLDHPRNHALLDDRVGACPQAGAKKNVLDVAPAHLLVVDEIARFALACQYPLDGDLAVLTPLPHAGVRCGIGIVEYQLHAGARHRLALRRAIEDHVLHRLAAQGGRLGFTEHPAHRVDDVGFSAAIRADDADQLARHAHGGGIDE